jgi:hypothetical protein
MPTLAYSCVSTPISSADFNNLLTTLEVDAATAWTILKVESSQAGYLPDRRPQILFESHQFHIHTGGVYDATNPDISKPAWVRDYAGGAGEYTRLAEAYALDAEAALMSASWGIGQVMGANFGQNPGFASAADLAGAACASEGAQLLQFQNFLVKKGVVPYLQAHDWVNVATLYNGSGQVATYANNLNVAYGGLQNPAHIPDLDVRAAQLYLRFLSDANQTPAWNPAAIDGIWGGHTQAALNAFQTAQGLPVTSSVDDQVLASLVAALPAAVDLDLS